MAVVEQIVIQYMGLKQGKHGLFFCSKIIKIVGWEQNLIEKFFGGELWVWAIKLLGYASIYNNLVKRDNFIARSISSIICFNVVNFFQLFQPVIIIFNWQQNGYSVPWLSTMNCCLTAPIIFNFY